MIPFNKPYLTGKEMHYIYQAVYNGKISGNGIYTQKCQKYFEQKYNIHKTLMTTSCTDALEMSAILSNIQHGDEVIMPSYTFVSTAVSFIRQGANIIFCDSRVDHPGIDESRIEDLVTPRTKVIVPVHYAGVACDMDKIMEIAKVNNLIVVEDAAQAIESFYKDKSLGSIGHLSAFSFHETKNICTGEGGLLGINDAGFAKRSEIVWEKGTNRSEFFRGEINKYGWVDVGSSFLPSEIISAYLYAQIENIEDIHFHRKRKWNLYFDGLKKLADKEYIKLPFIPEYATNNAHMFYIILQDATVRQNLIEYLKRQEILAVFHYLSLHKSPYYKNIYKGKGLRWSDYYSDCLLRLPMFYELTEEDISFILENIYKFFNEKFC